MQKLQESLDDFLNSIEPQTATPPSAVSLRSTGEVEVLRPLAIDEVSAKPANGLLLQHGAPRISWFHRSLIFGGGAIAAVAVIFLSAVFIAVNEPSDRVAADGIESSGYPLDGSIDISLAAAEDQTTADVFTAIEPVVLGELRSDRPVVRSNRNAVRAYRSAYIPRSVSTAPQPAAFVPTTLVIYAENGEIKTRIEPNLSAVYKAPSTFSN
jgi:hypothetical protein